LDRGTPRLLPRRTPPHRRRRPPQRPRHPRPRRPRQRSRRNPLEHPLTPRQPPTPKGGAWPTSPPLGGSGGHAPLRVPFASPSPVPATLPGGFVKVGFIGLGHMGGPMSRNVLAAGHDLVVHDI